MLNVSLFLKDHTQVTGCILRLCLSIHCTVHLGATHSYNMAIHAAVTDDVHAPSPPPNNANSSSVSDSSKETAATSAAAMPSDPLPNEERETETDGREHHNGEVPGRKTSDSAGARSISPRQSAGARSPSRRPRYSRRRSRNNISSDSDAPLEDRILRAPRQKENMIRYTQLMEDRVQALESKVKSLEGNKKSSQSASMHDAAVKKDPLEKHKFLNCINRVNETEYKKKGQRHLIDVLIKDPMDAAVDKDHPSGTSDTQKPAGRLRDSTSTATPDRIRINCGRLLVELDNISKQETESVFLAPFTFFTVNEQKLRDHVVVLEKESRGEDVATDSEVGAGEAAEEVDLRKNKEALGQSQQPPQSSGEAVNHAEKTDGQTVKNPEPTDGAKTTRDTNKNDGEKEEEDEEEEDIDESDLVAEDILAVVEDCCVSRPKAVKALKEEGESWPRACMALRRSMTKEQLRRADAAKAGFLLQSWKTMIALMDSDLRPKMELCSKIRNQTLEEIAYEDLGYLFKPGDVVLASQDQRLQALAVLATTGGRKLLRDTRVRKASDDEEPEPFFHTSGGHSPFVVDCFNYDFDGTNFGAILRSITIPKYEGKTPVNMLAVYPESLSGDAHQNVKKILVERGRKFVQLCSMSGIAHRAYIGRTLDEPPEEVDSQVIIDCHMAAIVPSDQRPDKAQWMPILGMTQPTEPDEREITEAHADCYHQDCGICNNPRSSNVFNHQRFARQQSRDYLTKEEIVNRPFGEGELREHHIMLLPYRVFGFVLQSRKWGKHSFLRITRQILTYLLGQHV